ncbi:MAG: hypothetical protein DRI65_16645, partial [Chloroflexota bacterium]
YGSVWTRTRPFHEFELHIDSNDAAWCVKADTLQSYGVYKLSGTTFSEKGSRTITDWSTVPKGIKDIGVYQDGDDLHIVWVDTNSTATGEEVLRYVYSCWEMDTETWAVEDEIIHTVTDDTDTRFNTPALAVRSTGEVVVLHIGDDVTIGTYTNPSTRFSRRTGTDTWVTTTINPTAFTNWGTVCVCGITLGTSNRVHMFYSGQEADGDMSWQIRHRSISSTNTLDTDAAAFISTTSTAHPDHWSVTEKLDGTDLYQYMMFNKGSSMTPIIKWVSGANPTFTVETNPDTGGSNDRRTDYEPYDQIHHAGTVFTSADGYVNVVRGEDDNYYDGYGGFVYTQKSLSGNFDFRRQMVGAYKGPEQARLSSDEWPWPIIRRPFYSGHFKKGSTDYVYFIGTEHEKHANVRFGMDSMVIWELSDMPINSIAHVTDAALRATKDIFHETDVILVAEGATQTITSFTDTRLVDIETTDHDTDVHLISVETVTHATDVTLEAIIDVEVEISIGFSMSSTYEVIDPAPLTGDEGRKYRHGTTQPIVDR